MNTTRKPSKCQSCGHRTTNLAPKRSTEFDAIATDAGFDPEQMLATAWSCDGDLFDLDGPVQCLRRMTSR